MSRRVALDTTPFEFLDASSWDKILQYFSLRVLAKRQPARRSEGSMESVRSSSRFVREDDFVLRKIALVACPTSLCRTLAPGSNLQGLGTREALFSQSRSQAGVRTGLPSSETEKRRRWVFTGAKGMYELPCMSEFQPALIL